MDFDLPGDRSRTTVPVPPGMALAVATIVAAGVTGLAVAGLTWTLDRPAEIRTGAPPEVAFERSPEPSATGPIDTPGWAEALGLPAPAPVTSGGDPAGAVPAPPVPPGLSGVSGPSGPEETARRAAAARRPVVGPTASVRSTPNAAAAAPTAGTAPAAGSTVAGSAPAVAGSGPVVAGSATAGSGGDGTTDPGAVTDPATGPVTDAAGDPAAGLAAGADAEPTAAETTAPRRRWEPPRRTWHDDEPQPAPAPQWGGPFGDFPRMFPWG
ncbi:hypothetical protein [Virgisporangium ochraceum]|uniref:Uncharacterized protein n=1 Tax=Virgisporangium ochraceum TaxID=65505 RepID=A0A8J3ZP17_9ACTN|nr:hypothetical protein [Virgisporangium ochraceum]GIJ66393.1 hypothetical protein Voc01_013100 [Virgisporangium ochraceum]